MSPHLQTSSIIENVHYHLNHMLHFFVKSTIRRYCYLLVYLFCILEVSFVPRFHLVNRTAAAVVSELGFPARRRCARRDGPTAARVPCQPRAPRRSHGTTTRTAVNRTRLATGVAAPAGRAPPGRTGPVGRTGGGAVSWDTATAVSPSWTWRICELEKSYMYRFLFPCAVEL